MAAQIIIGQPFGSLFDYEFLLQLDSDTERCSKTNWKIFTFYFLKALNVRITSFSCWQATRQQQGRDPGDSSI